MKADLPWLAGAFALAALLQGAPAFGQTGEPAPAFRRFNQADFSLAFEAMLAAGDQKHAFELAQQAVQQVPDDRSWRLKLAHVAEWTQHPEVAAQQWLALFQLGDHSAQTVESVLRLSRLVEDTLALVEVWNFKATQAPLTDAQWAQVLAIFEMAAEPVKGSMYFEQQFQRTGNKQLLEYAAQLAENSGDDERAVTLWQQRSRIRPFSTEAVMALAQRLSRLDRVAQARDLLRDRAGAVPADALPYWQLMAQVAWEAQDSALSEQAYQRIIDNDQAGLADWSRLIFLVRQQHPDRAAELALEAYRRFRSFDQFLLALDLLEVQGDEAARDRVLLSLRGESLKEAEGNLRFLTLRAQWYQRHQQPELAWADLKAALALSPQDRDLLLSALWLLVDAQRTEELEPLLRLHAERAIDDADFWPVYAAGSQLLGWSREALYWFRKEVQRSPDDPVLLLNYADALDGRQQAAMAARVRRHAWLQVRGKTAAPDLPADLSKSPAQLVAARLAMENSAADPALQQVRRWVAASRDQSAEQSDAEVNGPVLGWAMAQEQYANASGWMWWRYPRQGRNQAPAWARAQVALQRADLAGMQRLLDENPRGIAASTRYDMAMALGHVAQAHAIALEGQRKMEEPEALYDRVRQHEPRFSNYLQVALGSQHTGSQIDDKDQAGTLDTQSLEVEARLSPREDLQVVLDWAHRHQTSDNPAFADPLPEADRLLSAEVIWLRPRGQTSVTVFDRSAVQQQDGLRVNARQNLETDRRVDVEASLAVHDASTLSLPLRLGGYENSVRANVGYALGRQEYLRVAPSASEYFSPAGERWGRGLDLELEAGYRIRSDYPDWRVRVMANRQQLEASEGIGTYFIPESTTSVSACVDLGENLAGQDIRGTYSRAWRPFADLCFVHNMTTGDGHTATVGLVGSVLGRDHLSVELQNSEDSQPGSATTGTLSVRYRHYF